MQNRGWPDIVFAECLQHPEMDVRFELVRRLVERALALGFPIENA